MVSYYRPIVTVYKMHRFRDMTTYWLKIVEKNPTPSFSTFFGVTLANFSASHAYPETRVMGLSDGIHFTILGTIPACDGQTDGQTDRHVAVAKTRASIASRG